MAKTATLNKQLSGLFVEFGSISNLSEATFSYLNDAGEIQATTISDLTKGKKAILFAIPRAFTPTYSQKHVSGFVEKSAELKAKGMDTIACISVNDEFMMKA
ncbi:Peroxiredoxin-2E-2 [Arachis hypogaea]|nr:Peroxiredoxin-2E-2 [Arachis hypogaea]